jgi:hypothetical protein
MLTKTFVIEEKELTDELQMPDGPYVYNGSPIMPVMIDGLAEGRDYTITYENNINAGTATVIIVGQGNYYGTLSETFTISPKPITVAPLEGQGKAFGTNDPILLYTIQDGTRGIVLNGSLSREAGEHKGKFLITIGTLGHANYIITFIHGIEFEIAGENTGGDIDDNNGIICRTYSLPIVAFCLAIITLMFAIVIGMWRKKQKQ